MQNLNCDRNHEISGAALLPKVGIAIPAFNVENYIKLCIESILRQTYTNIAIAIVNDGSTDGTWKIIQEYMVHNPSVIRGINSDNRGVMQARLTCIDKLEDCKYIMFVDADDYLIDTSIIDKCVINMQTTDMVCFNAEQNGNPCFNLNEIKHITRIDGIRNILNRQYFDGNLWGGLYKYWYVKKFFKVMECNNDDYINKAAFINACDKITIIPDIGYYYRVNTESQTHRKIRESDYLFFSNVCEFCLNIRYKYPELRKETEYFESWVLLWLVTGMHKNKESKKLNIYKTAMQEFSKRTKIYLFNSYFNTKDRITYLCVRLHIFRVLYKIYHRL